MENSIKLNFIVGLFMLGMIAILAVVILGLGRKKGFVGETTVIYTYFNDISGLKKDHGIYLYGKYVGSVQNIEFPKGTEDERIKVTLSIRQPFVPFIRKDATAKITSKGIMGGRKLTIKAGRHAESVQSGDVIVGYIAADPIQAVETAGEILIRTKDILNSLGTIIDNYRDSALLDYLIFLAQSIEKTARAIEGQEGLLGSLIYGKEYKEDIGTILKNLKRSTKNIYLLTNDAGKIVSNIRKITDALQNNKKSLVHQVIYGDLGERLVTPLLATVNRVDRMTAKIEGGDGLVHQLIYEKDQIIPAINDSVTKLNKVTTAIYEGRGSLGGIIMDPTIYEDLKKMFGKVKRNQILKSLIRFSIQQEEK